MHVQYNRLSWRCFPCISLQITDPLYLGSCRVPREDVYDYYARTDSRDMRHRWHHEKDRTVISVPNQLNLDLVPSMINGDRMAVSRNIDPFIGRDRGSKWKQSARIARISAVCGLGGVCHVAMHERRGYDRSYRRTQRVKMHDRTI